MNANGGQRLQVTGTAVVVGSKESGEGPKSGTDALRETLAQAILDGDILVQVKQFSTGSKGFMLSGKITL